MSNQKPMKNNEKKNLSENYNPNKILREMRKMQEQMDSLFDHFFYEDPFFSRDDFLANYEDSIDKSLMGLDFKRPVSNIYETDKEIVAEFEIPGIDKNNIEVNVDEDCLEVKAQKNKEDKEEDKKKGFYRYERDYSGFYQRFALPKNIDTEKSNAEYKDGILKISIPKKEIENKKRKKLSIR